MNKVLDFIRTKNFDFEYETTEEIIEALFKYNFLEEISNNFNVYFYSGALASPIIKTYILACMEKRMHMNNEFINFVMYGIPLTFSDRSVLLKYTFYTNKLLNHVVSYKLHPLNVSEVDLFYVTDARKVGLYGYNEVYS